jgi:hypothetical protein
MNFVSIRFSKKQIINKADKDILEKICDLLDSWNNLHLINRTMQGDV